MVLNRTPEGLEDVSKYPDLVAELLRRKWTDDEIRDALGGNLLRVFRKVEEVRARHTNLLPVCSLKISKSNLCFIR